jgi:hypothetical protein
VLAPDVPDKYARVGEQWVQDRLGTLNRQFPVVIDGQNVDQNLCLAENEQDYANDLPKWNKWLTTPSGEALLNQVAWIIANRPQYPLDPPNQDDFGPRAGGLDGAAP